MKKVLFIIICLLFASSAFAEWSPPDNAWPDTRTGYWSTNAGVLLYDAAPWDSYTQGASVSSGASAAQIQSCLNSSSPGEYCYMNAGTYNIGSTQINIPAGVELRGAGGLDHSVTITYTGIAKAFYMGTNNNDSDISITSGDVNKGDTTFTVSNASSLTAGGVGTGSVIMLKEAEDNQLVDKDGENSCTWCGDENGDYVIQFVRVTAKNGNEITVSRPAYFQYDTGEEIARYNFVQRSGISGVYVNATSNSCTTNNVSACKDGLIFIQQCEECWVRDVDIYDAASTAVWIEYSHGVVVGNSYLHQADVYGSDRGYMIWLAWPNSDHYIFNNTIARARYGINFEGGGSGVVIAYNYIRDVVEGDYTPWLHAGIGFHGAHPNSTLMEGNILPSIDPDNTFGSSTFGMAFRNWIGREYFVTWYTITDALWANEVELNSQYYSFVGNILGYYNMSGSYEANSCSGSDLIFRWGCDSPGGSSHNNDAYNTRYVHHNYDYVNSQITNWGADDTDLPNSLYLSSKPDFLASGDDWPPLDVDNGNNDFANQKFNTHAGTAYYIPAYRRYHSISDPPAGAPIVSSATIGADGQTVTVTCSENMAIGAGGNGGLTMTAPGGATTLTYSSISGADIIYTSSRLILKSSIESGITLDYTQPTDGWEADDDQTDLATFADQAVTNNSEQFGVPSPTGMTSAGGVTCY